MVTPLPAVAAASVSGLTEEARRAGTALARLQAQGRRCLMPSVCEMPAAKTAREAPRGVSGPERQMRLTDAQRTQKPPGPTLPTTHTHPEMNPCINKMSQLNMTFSKTRGSRDAEVFLISSRHAGRILPAFIDPQTLAGWRATGDTRP